ncbi:MAG TPA: hypothetical protein VMR97_14485, partial [Acidimicrobiales bacterium]|nr:hypothetical protein [Acidimicrobiales bacterium]
MRDRTPLKMTRRTLTVLGISAVALVAAACSTSTPTAKNAKNAAHTAASGTSAADTVLARSVGSLGTILVDNKGRTLYSFTLDSGGKSACYAGCDTTWPPLLVAAGTTPKGGPGVHGTLGTITRTDPGLQVTINGTPLYTYSGDSAPGQTNGEGIDSTWYVVPATAATSSATTTAPSGSGSGTPTTTTPSGSGAGSGSGSNPTTTTRPSSGPASTSPTSPPATTP